MKTEEFYPLTEDNKKGKFTEKEWSKYLSWMITSAQERISWYRKTLEEIHKHKDIWPPDNIFVIWYREDIRDSLNMEQRYLKELVKEKTYENNGLSWPHPK